jgi:proteasome lid subunit RPN8/RPN11
VLYKDDKQIFEYFVEQFPKEGCGLLQNKKGKLYWIPCENKAENPEEDFYIDPKEYIKASLSGDIYAIVHSHPDTGEEPSEADIKASDFLGIPYHIYSLETMKKYEYIPKKLRTPLLGRNYEFGKYDCYSLVRDYYENLGIILPNIPFEDDWWLKGLNYFDELFDAFGFVEVEEPQEHDGIILQVYCEVPNHCGIYLGEDIFMHHAVYRLSCRESLYSGWRQHVKRFVRCKEFI